MQSLIIWPPINAGTTEEPAYYYYAAALKANQKFDQAKQTLESYLAKGEDEPDCLYGAEGTGQYRKAYICKRKSKLFQGEKPGKKSIHRVPNIHLSITTDIYILLQIGMAAKFIKTTGTPFTDIFKIKTKGAKVDLATLAPLPEIINSPNVNEGSIAISRNGSSVIFAKGNNGKYTGTNEVDLYFTRVRNGRWTKPRIINASRRDSWDSSPALSPDGNTLYFASNQGRWFWGYRHIHCQN